MHTERVAALKAFHEESRAQRPEELPVDLAAELQIAGVDRVAIEYRRWLREIAKGSDAAAKPPSNDVGTGSTSTSLLHTDEVSATAVEHGIDVPGLLLLAIAR